MRGRSLILGAVFLFAAGRLASGVIFLETDDPLHNATTPGDNSGWQYEGQFGGFTGTPIAPRYFITAQHIGGNEGDSFVFHGEVYHTTTAYSDPTTDLRIWQVDHDFPDYAPLYQGGAEVGQELRVCGRGTLRGVERTLNGQVRGWDWGTYDGLPRWGRNLVEATVTFGQASYLVANFDSPGVPDEAHLTYGDSGGGVFVLEDGLWKLAAVNYGVDDFYTDALESTLFYATLFDARGFYAKDANGNFFQIPDTGVNAPSSFYSTRTAPRLDWIGTIIGSDPSALAPESDENWQALYFTPAEIADDSTTDTNADADGDGIPNLLEFAFNLDPTYAESAVMVAGTGLRGLPLILPELVGEMDTRLTVEYVRRTAASGSGIDYAVQWTSSLAPDAVDWQTGGTESVTPINARWERVKVTDTVSLGSGSPARFARVAVTLATPL